MPQAMHGKRRGVPRTDGRSCKPIRPETTRSRHLGKGSEVQLRLHARQLIQVSPKALRLMGRFFQEKAASGFLSLPLPFKIRVNSSDLPLESRALMIPREGDHYLNVDSTGPEQEKERKVQYRGLEFD